MNLYRISQVENTGYDTYDSAVVAAEDENAARQIHPCKYGDWGDMTYTWASSPDTVIVEYIGTATPGIRAGTIICASLANTCNCDKLLAALILAKDMFIANDFILPHTFEVIDEAIALVNPPKPEEE